VFPIVGLIPAAGQGERVAPLPGSKELFPIGFHTVTEQDKSVVRPKVVSQYLLESMMLCGVKKVYMIINRSKCDILRYYGNGSKFGMNISYLVVDRLLGMPYTLNQAYPWLTKETVVFGMPDTIFTPKEAYVPLLERHWDSRSDVTLGLFKTTQPERFGMVTLGKNDMILNVRDKTVDIDSIYMWGIACWSPRFTSFMAEWLKSAPDSGAEVVLSRIFQSAIHAGLSVEGFRFDDGEYIDIGTPLDLKDAVRRFA